MFDTTVPTVKWDVPGTADPVANVIAAKRAIRTRTGEVANFMIIPLDVLWDLIQVDEVKSNSNAVLDARAGAIANAAFLRVLFDIPEIFIPGVSKLTSTAPSSAHILLTPPAAIERSSLTMPAACAASQICLSILSRSGTFPQ